MNALGRLAAKADLNLADMSRRAIDSVTMPVKIRSQEVIAELTQSVTTIVKTLLIKAALAVFACVTAIIALAYALSALHGYLARITGPLEATLIMAGIFALIAVVALILLMVWPKSSKPAADATAKMKREADAVLNKAKRDARATARLVADAPQQATDTVGGLDAIAAALGEAGLRREQAGLRAGMALAEQLRPVQLVSMALLGGFIAGLRMTRRR